MGGISVMFLLGMLSFLFFVFIAVLVLAVIFTVVRYILDGISVMRMAENLKFRHSGTAWIPFYNSFMIGKLRAIALSERFRAPFCLFPQD